MKKNRVIIASLSMVLCFVGCREKAPQLSEKNIDKVVAAMTLEEKAALVVGIAMDKGIDSYEATIGNSGNRVPGAAGATHAIPRLGIPSTILSDGPAGLRIDPTREGEDRTYYCTHFPIGSLLAATWDQELVEKVGEAMGNEVLEYGCDVLLAPAENIHRNPLNGRNFEYYSEDPVLSGKTAAAYVRGIQKNGVGTSIKHFAYNNQETNRTGNNAVISARAQREIYLKGFEITLRESDPWTVMSSYNRSNGVYTSENHELLEDVLRSDWGYKGIVMTDWSAGRDAIAQVEAGNDMLQPGRPSQYKDIIEGVTTGELSMADLDRNVKRILQFIVKTPSFKRYKYGNNPDLKAHAEVTRQSATEGMVLLKNESALPLRKEIKKAAVYGVTSYEFIAGGTGSGNVNSAYTVSLLDGLKNADITVDAQIEKKYSDYREARETVKKAEAKEAIAVAEMFLPPTLATELIPTAAELAQAVRDNDVALITLGRISGEALDRKHSDFNLSQEEQQLIKSVSKAFHAAGKRCIVVLNVGGVIETASWYEQPDAILLAWQAGQEGGNSVADVLTGKANPCGKLPMTWPVSVADHASSRNFPKAENFGSDWTANIALQNPVNTFNWTCYEEDIYVGYRWFDKQQMRVAYPFGYGLSYTSFDYSEAKVVNDGKNITVSVVITNSGKVAGKEIVQVYASAPGIDMDKPIQELKAFAKTRELAAGESQTLTIQFAVSDLASFDEEISSWVVEAGTYTIKIGASSRDIRAALQTEVKNKTWQVNDVLHKQTGDPSVIIERTKKFTEPATTDTAAFAEFYGIWDITVSDVPTMGNIDMVMKVTEEGETAKVTLTAYKVMTVEIERPTIRGGKMEFSYFNSGMQIPITIEKVSPDEVKGMMMESLKITGIRKQ